MLRESIDVLRLQLSRGDLEQPCAQFVACIHSLKLHAPAISPASHRIPHTECDIIASDYLGSTANAKPLASCYVTFISIIRALDYAVATSPRHGAGTNTPEETKSPTCA